MFNLSFFDRLFEDQEQLTGQATDQQPGEVGPKVMIGQPVGKAHVFYFLDTVFTPFCPLDIYPKGIPTVLWVFEGS